MPNEGYKSLQICILYAHNLFVIELKFCVVSQSIDRIMAQAVKQNMEDWKAKLDAALHEDNCIAHAFEKIESKTGVKRLHVALG